MNYGKFCYNQMENFVIKIIIKWILLQKIITKHNIGDKYKEKFD